MNEEKYLFVKCGTPGYISPEILEIKDKDKAKIKPCSDMFSVGVIFYYMIFGNFLF